MRHMILAASAALTLTALAPLASAQDARPDTAADTAEGVDLGLFLGTGYNYSSGKYGTTTTTTIQSAPLLASVEYGDLSVDLTVPFLNVNGDPNVIPGVGRVVNKNPKKRSKAGTATGSASGIGDVVAEATWDAYTNDAYKFGFSLSGKVKFGTGDKSQGLGDGATDYSVGLGAFKTFGPLTLTADVGYTALGSSNYIALKKNLMTYSVGALYRASDKVSLGLSYDAGGQAALGISGTTTRELTAFAAYKLAKHWKLQGYGLAGFSDGSPDFGGGASLKYAF